MYYLIYTSTAVVPPTEADLAQILLSSDKNNGRDEITGLLLFHNGSFIQMLEGDEGKVRSTFDRITRDPRHYGVRKLGFGNSNQRFFPDWRMAFEPVDEDTMERAQAISMEEAGDFINQEQGEHIGIKLLRLFYQMKMNG